MDAPPDLEAEYNNRARVPGAVRIIAGWARDSTAYRAEADERGLRERLAYGPGERHVLDLYRPENDRTPGAVVLFIHGGYWQALSPDQFGQLARGLNRRGHAVAVVGYDLCPSVRIGDIVEQMRAACTLLGRERRLVLAGHSAGGHLSACMLATDWAARGLPGLVPAAYAISGLFDLAPLMPTSINGALRLDEAEARRESPLFWPAPAGLILDAVVGGTESDEFHRQSRTMAEVWGRAGVATRFEILEGCNHFTVVAPLAEPDTPMTRRIGALVEDVAPR